jgi:hypothetical protein
MEHPIYDSRSKTRLIADNGYNGKLAGKERGFVLERPSVQKREVSEFLANRKLHNVSVLKTCIRIGISIP